MYGGLNKDGGGIVGYHAVEETYISTADDAALSSSAEETLLGETKSSSGETFKYALSASIDIDTGNLSWKHSNVEESLSRTIAMGQMTGMLNDHDRNDAYSKAITFAIQQFVQNNQRAPLVLDIGAGTGLLSMIAAAAGAEHVHCCEMFDAMADIAKEVTSLNCSGLITVHNVKSTQLKIFEQNNQIGERHEQVTSGFLPRKADILINEIYDSALLGEAALPAIRDAMLRLLVHDPVIIPESAEIWGRVISSVSLRASHQLDNTEMAPEFKFARNEEAEGCTGGRSPIPIRFDSLLDAAFLSDTFLALDFDFKSPQTLLFKPKTSNLQYDEQNIKMFAYRHRAFPIAATANGWLDGLVTWWVLHLGNGITYSTKMNEQNWQDHWVQVLYPVPGTREKVESGDEILIKAGHADFQVYLEAIKYNEFSPVSKCSMMKIETDVGTIRKYVSCPSLYKFERDWMPDPCSCGWHLVYGPDRISALNNMKNHDDTLSSVKILLEGLGTIQDSQKIALDVSDGSVLSAAALHSGCGAIVSLEQRQLLSLLASQAFRRAGVEERVMFVESLENWPICAEVNVVGDDNEQQVQFVPIQAHCMLAEPYHPQLHSSPLLQALSILGQRRCAVNSGAIQIDTPSIPFQAEIKAALYSLPHLAACHGPVNHVLGFDHTPYNKRVQNWSSYSYPYNLGVYNCRALSAPKLITTIKYVQGGSVEGGELIELIPMCSGHCDAIVLWVDYIQFEPGQDLCSIGGNQQENYCESKGNFEGGCFNGVTKQIVRFLEPSFDLDISANDPKIFVSLKLDEEGGNFHICVEVKKYD